MSTALVRLQEIPQFNQYMCASIYWSNKGDYRRSIGALARMVFEMEYWLVPLEYPPIFRLKVNTTDWRGIEGTNEPI